MRSHAYVKSLTLGLVCLLLTTSVPFVAQAASGPVRVCFEVKNGVGWALEGVNVTAIMSAADDPGAVNTFSKDTDPNGYAEIDVPPALDPYTVLVRDDLAPSSALRNGAVYEPASDTTKLVVSSATAVAGACNGARGIAFSTTAAPTVLASPGEGFLDILTRDAVADQAPALRGVTVAPVINVDSATPNAASVTTGADGKLRMACFSGTTSEPANLTFQRTDYIAFATSVPCAAATSGAATTLIANMWRTALAIDIRTHADRSVGDISGASHPECSPITAAQQTNSVTHACVSVDPSQPNCVSNIAQPPAPSSECGPAAITSVAPPDTVPTDPLSTTADVPINTSTATLGAVPATLSQTMVSNPNLCRSAGPQPIDTGQSRQAPLGIGVPGVVGTVNFQPAVPVVTGFQTQQSVQNAQPILIANPIPPYECTSSADSAGRVTLLLPWAEAGAKDYEIDISAPGYGVSKVTESILAPDTLTGDAHDITPGATPSVRVQDVKLARAIVSLSIPVVDITNSSLAGITVAFLANGQPVASAVSDSTGNAAITSIPTGSYTLSLTDTQAPARTQARTCTLDVGLDASGNAFYANVKPWYCFMLVSAGKSAFIGKVADMSTRAGDQSVDGKPIPGLVLQSGSATTTTTGDGSFRLELAPNTAVTTLAVPAGQAWTAIDAGTAPTILGTGSNSGPAGTISVVGTAQGQHALEVDRRATPILVRVVDQTDTIGLADAYVRIRRDSTVIDAPPQTSPAKPMNITNADGYNVSVLDSTVVWTKINATTACDQACADSFTLSPYFVMAARYMGASNDNVSHYIAGSTSFHLYPDTATLPEQAYDGYAPGTFVKNVHLTLDPDAGVVSVSVVAHDLNANNADAATIVNATLGTNTPAAGAVSAGPVNVVSTPGSFQLYTGNGTYQVCSRATTLYQAGCPSGLTGVNAATAAATGLVVPVKRTTSTIKINAHDAHTGLTVTNLDVSAVAATGFSCTGTCTGTTSTVPGTPTAPQATLVVPWTSGDSDICVRGRSNANTHVTNLGQSQSGQSIDQMGEAVPFQDAKLCQKWAPGATTTLDLTPRRARAALPLVGSVVAAGSDPIGLETRHGIPSAHLTAAVERPQQCQTAPGETPPQGQVACDMVFTCDPTLVETALVSYGQPFPDCANGASGPDGRFSLALPSVAQNDTWRVTAARADTYTETFSQWPAAQADKIAPVFVLYPKEFDAIVRITPTTDLAQFSSCPSADSDFPVTAGLRDVQDQTADASENTWTSPDPATPQPDGTCLDIIHVADWHRDPPAMPAALGQAWPKATEPFLVRAKQQGAGSTGATLAELGPAARSVEVVMTRASASASPDPVQGQLTACLSSDTMPSPGVAQQACSGFESAKALAGGSLPGANIAQEIADCVQSDKPAADSPATTVCSEFEVVKGQIPTSVTPPALPVDPVDNATQIAACVTAGTPARWSPATTVCDNVATAKQTINDGPGVATREATNVTDNESAIAACAQTGTPASNDPAKTACSQIAAATAAEKAAQATLTQIAACVTPGTPPTDPTAQTICTQIATATAAASAAKQTATEVQACATTAGTHPTTANGQAICAQIDSIRLQAGAAQATLTQIAACITPGTAPTDATATTVCAQIAAVRAAEASAAENATTIAACIPANQTAPSGTAQTVCAQAMTATNTTNGEKNTLQGNGAFTISGRVLDGNALATVSAQLGVVATVVAHDIAGACPDVSATALPNGTYNIGVNCAATYRVTATPTLTQLWTPASITASVSTSTPHATGKDVSVPRTTGAITVQQTRGSCDSINVIAVDHVAPVVTAECGAPFISGLPWGAYELVPNTGTLGAQHQGAPAFVVPGQTTRAVIVAA